MKKTTNWITIPEEKIHTPASDEGGGKTSKKSSAPKVKNKLFWGAGFVVLIIASFALLAPAQFGQLLKGSLFDTSGLSPEEMKVSIVPEKTTDGEKSASETGNSMVADAASESAAPDLIVQPESEAVSISVDPIKVEPDPLQCADSLPCFIEALKTCMVATVNFEMPFEESTVKSVMTLASSENGNCAVGVNFSEGVKPEALSGSLMDCQIKQGEYTSESLNELFKTKSFLDEQCDGQAVAFISDTITKPEEKPSEEPADSAQAQLINDLKNQIDNLQNQRAEDVKALQDLVEVVTDQEAVHPSAGNQPSSVVSTAAIGQPSTLQPGFRLNTHTVSVTPEEMLRRNTGAQATAYKPIVLQNQLSNQQVGAQYGQTQSGTSFANAGSTPETGPSEVLLLTFVITFLGLVFRRFIGIFA